jgi:hypothetical protein
LDPKHIWKDADNNKTQSASHNLFKWQFLVQEGEMVYSIGEDGLDCNFKNTKINSMLKVFEFYSSKYGALASQIVSIQSEKGLKLEQAENKLKQADSK